METLSIQTLPIEIHVVKVGNRQMTKNIFKQIPFISVKMFLGELLNIEPEPFNYKLIGWLNYKPEGISASANIDLEFLLECHLAFYDALEFYHYSQEREICYYARYWMDDFKEAYQRFFHNRRPEPGILFPQPRNKHGEKTLAEIPFKDVISVLLHCKSTNTLRRSYLPIEYLNAFVIPQIYIAT